MAQLAVNCWYQSGVFDDNGIILDNFQRYVLAGNAKCSQHVLAVLANDTWHDVRRRVAENPSTTVGCLVQLSNDSHPCVRMAVSENPNLPRSILLRLCLDSHPDVRHYIAENCQMPDEILGILCGDENPYVASRAVKSLSAKRARTFRAGVANFDEKTIRIASRLRGLA